MARELNMTMRGPWGDMDPIEDEAGLRGISAIQKYTRMRRGDPTCAAMYWVLTLPVRNVAWTFEAGGDSTADDEAAAEFVESAFDDMSMSFAGFLSDVCSMFTYGWAWFRMVMKRRREGQSRYDDGLVGFKKLKQVPHRAFVRWVFDEGTGDIEGLTVRTKQGNETIKLAESLLFRTSREGDDPEGISIYRPAVRPYEYKRRLEKTEGIGLYRRWAGFPKVTYSDVPADMTEQEMEEKAEEIAVAIYKDRLMGYYGPDAINVDLGGPEGNIDKTMGDTIIRKDAEMTRSILAQWLLLGLKSVGTQALAKTLFEGYELALGAYLDIIAKTVNRYAIPYLFKFNQDAFAGMTGLPTANPGDPRSVDLKAVSVFLRSMSSAGLMTADLTTENFLRSLVPGMPEADEALYQERQEEAKRLRMARDQEDEDEVEEGDEEGEEEPEPPEEGSRRAGGLAVESFARQTKPAASGRPGAYRDAADSHAAAQRENLEGWANEAAEEISQMGEHTSEAELRDKLDDLVLAALLLFREQSVLDISAAFWMGFGRPAGGSEHLPRLQEEISLADRWMGYGAGGELRRTNPAGKPTLFGDVAGTLEGRIAAILLLLKQGKEDEVFAEVIEGCKTATRGFYRGELYAGHVWHAIWAGAIERDKAADYYGPVRWVLDPIAHHCRECPIYGDDPPGKEYPSIDSLISVTGGVLPGHGTECDGNCRCHLEKLENGQWVWM